MTAPSGRVNIDRHGQKVRPSATVIGPDRQAIEDDISMSSSAGAPEDNGQRRDGDGGGNGPSGAADPPGDSGSYGGGDLSDGDDHGDEAGASSNGLGDTEPGGGGVRDNAGGSAIGGDGGEASGNNGLGAYVGGFGSGGNQPRDVVCSTQAFDFAQIPIRERKHTVARL